MTPEKAIQRSIEHWDTISLHIWEDNDTRKQAVETALALRELLLEINQLDFDQVLRAEALFSSLAEMNGKHGNMVITVASKGEIKDDSKVVTRRIAITVTEPYVKPK